MKKSFIAVIFLSLIFLLGCSAQIERVNGDVENDITNEYVEISKISEEINLQDYSVYIESDNEDIRVILFMKDGKRTYKSVFVKDKKYLKLIDLKSGQKPLIDENI